MDSPPEKYLGVKIGSIADQVCDRSGDKIEFEPARDVLTVAFQILYDLRIRPNPAYAYQQARRDKGLCIRCGKPVWRPKSSYCNAHRLLVSQYARERRRAKLANG